jgi:penicillin-binding protein 1A
MAIRRAAPIQTGRRGKAAPLSPRGASALRPRPAFRWLRRTIKVVILLGVLALAAWIYAMRVYAPGLRAEASSIPVRVHSQLAAEGAGYTPLSQISPYLQQAIVAVEDRRFYLHPGIDPLGSLRALWINLTNQHIDQGGSTLEQQLVKRTIVPDDRSFHSKLRTIGIAWAVDQDFSKSQVLELYLNAAYYGRGAYGPDAAAEAYFGTDALHLSLPQAAFLAALPQAPSVFGADPTGPAIRQRWYTVLQDMRNMNDISPRQAATAEQTQLVFR